jgi:hypothetical protein
VHALDRRPADAQAPFTYRVLPRPAVALLHVVIDTDHQGKLLDPEALIDERGGARGTEHERQQRVP